MNLVITLFGVAVLAAGVLLLLPMFRPVQRPATDEAVDRPQLVGVSFTSAAELEMLLSDLDYRRIRSRPELKSTSRKFRRELTKIAVLWLAELRRDVLIVREFRRFLIVSGIPLRFQEEVRIGSIVSLALLYIGVNRILVDCCGQFAIPGLLRSARLLVESLSRQGAGLIAYAPAATRSQLEEKWAKHILTWNPA